MEDISRILLLLSFFCCVFICSSDDPENWRHLNQTNDDTLEISTDPENWRHLNQTNYDKLEISTVRRLSYIRLPVKDIEDGILFFNPLPVKSVDDGEDCGECYLFPIPVEHMKDYKGGILFFNLFPMKDIEGRLRFFNLIPMKDYEGRLLSYIPLPGEDIYGRILSYIPLPVKDIYGRILFYNLIPGEDIYDGEDCGECYLFPIPVEQGEDYKGRRLSYIPLPVKDIEDPERHCLSDGLCTEPILARKGVKPWGPRNTAIGPLLARPDMVSTALESTQPAGPPVSTERSDLASQPSSPTAVCLATAGTEPLLDPEEKVPVVFVNQTTEWFLSSSLTTVFQPIVYMVVVVVGLPTNVLAVWVFLFRTKKKHPSSIYMANLALADLLFIVWIPLKISYHFNGNDWIYGLGLCKVLVAFFYGNMYCSMLFITCISVQRYWAVVYPLSQCHRSTCVATCVTLAVWVLVWVCTAPLYLYDQLIYVINLNLHTCNDLILESQSKKMAGFFLTMVTLCFLVPSLVCIISYVLTLKALRNTMEDLVIAKKRRKAVVVIMVVLVMFLVCFVPNNLLIMVHYIMLLLNSPLNAPAEFSVITICLASLNSCLDPFLYYFICEDFREHVKNTFLCRSERTVQRMRVK